MLLARSFWLVKLLSRPKELCYNQKQLSIFNAKCFITKCYKLSRECRKSKLSNINKATLYSKHIGYRKSGLEVSNEGNLSTDSPWTPSHAFVVEISGTAASLGPHFELVRTHAPFAEACNNNDCFQKLFNKYIHNINQILNCQLNSFLFDLA